MISKRLLQLALVALSASQVAQAHYGAAVNGAMVRAEENLVKRQGSSSAPPASSGNPRPSSTTNAPAPSTTTTNRPSSSDPPRPTPSSSNEPTKPSTTTKSEPTESSSSDSQKPDTTPTEQPKTTSTLPPTTSTIIFTVTNTDGSISTGTSESAFTPAPTIVDQNQNNNTGMSEQTRNTIIGVVVGVGGAIILAVIGLFAWRIWGRKKAAEENDGLMDYGTPGYHPGPAEPKEPSVPGSSSVGTGRSPFQSTLESYHAPTQVNTASNF